MRSARVSVLVASIAIPLIAGGAVGVQSARSDLGPPALGGCLSKSLVRPSSIEFCGDGNFFMMGLKWTSWTTADAEGDGVAHQNNCSPSCASGRFRTYNVEVVLSMVKPCSNGEEEYTKLMYRFIDKRPLDVKAWTHVISTPLDTTPKCS